MCAVHVPTFLFLCAELFINNYAINKGDMGWGHCYIFPQPLQPAVGGNFRNNAETFSRK